MPSSVLTVCPPCLKMEAFIDGLDSLFRGLLRREARPVMVTVLAGVPGVTQISFSLLEPVVSAKRHGRKC